MIREMLINCLRVLSGTQWDHVGTWAPGHLGTWAPGHLGIWAQANWKNVIHHITYLK